VANESLTKEERICLSTQWPPDTKLFLKLLRVHDAATYDLEQFRISAQGAVDLNECGILTDSGCVEVIRSILK
jgi:hypothetical protein